ncbi:MAG TPA: ParB/RepB/Spo0J family partition protein [Mycobacteriales bacterium]|nr:ParB/RepB/Spo0J family partition protein [Mycobacteriales bacterium]
MSPGGARGGLGRGLASLIPAGQPASPVPAEDGVTGARFAEIPLDRIVPNPAQPRTVFDEDALAELVASIREVGLLQPIVVRAVAPDDDGPRYELVMGERRWRASQQAGTGTIPAIIRETADDVLLRDALLENLHRQQLNPLEEGAAYAQLLADFGVTHEELGSRLGRSRSTISNTIRLLGLPPAVQRRVAAGVLSAGHARAILGLPSAEAQERMAERVVAEGMSVRAVEEAVAVASPEPHPAPRRRRAAAAPTPELAEIGERLADRLQTRVSVDMGRRKGRLTIDFAGIPDLLRIASIVEGAAGDSEPAGGGAFEE